LMTRFRFSLLGLAGFVTAVAVACAALNYASPLVASAAVTAVLMMLTLATIMALVGARRCAFWAGFAVCGWVYLLVALGPFSLSQPLLTSTLTQRAAKALPGASQMAQGYYFTQPTGSVAGPAYALGLPSPATAGEGIDPATKSSMPTLSLPDGSAMPMLAPAAPGGGSPIVGTPPLNTVSPFGMAPYTYSVENSEYISSFTYTGEAIWALLFAFLGGLVGGFASRRRDGECEKAGGGCTVATDSR
jgi:hypothetical protein